MELQLNTRPRPYVLPSYSLTGDLLSFLRCGLQYRYNIIGRLPSSNPVQMWFGQFIHGVLEEAYRLYYDSKINGTPDLPPWDNEKLDGIINLIKDRMSSQGLFPWDRNVEQTGINRAKRAVNELGPDLFPIISQAEVRLRGTFSLPTIPQEYLFREANRYEISGIVDVITNFQFSNPEFNDNQIIKLILESLAGKIPEKFEVIIDYKGMRRPPLTGHENKLWDHYNWQIQTYAHLRKKQPDSLPIIAGVLIYVNELLLSQIDMEKLKQEIASRSTDIYPKPGSDDEKIINKWSGRGELPELSYDFRLKRAIRVIVINSNSMEDALKEFKKVVRSIEICRGKEHKNRDIFSSWEKNQSDPSTCTACDAKTYCPVSPEQSPPKLPGEKD